MVNYPNYDILSADKEHELAVLSNKGDKSARDLLILSNIRFVIYYAKKFSSYSYLEEDDLIQEGVAGMVYAANKFNAEKENKFITYAKFWIRNEIQKARRSAEGTPSNNFSNLCGDEDFSEEEYLSSASENPFAHFEDDYINGEVCKCVQKAVASLDEKEADVISRHYGLRNGKTESLSKIGESYDLTKSRVHQIEKSALKNLHASLDDLC